jgi:Uma2 family endonuclease
MASASRITSPATLLLDEPSLPPLESGDHLDQRTFHERYEAMPENFRAELIGGIVFTPSPLSIPHGRSHIPLSGWLWLYEQETPGVQAFDNVTVILGAESEPQPDGCLIIEPECGGQARSKGNYLHGAPEWMAEIASSTEAIDLHLKKADYEKAGVKEYVVVALRQRRVFWFVARKGRFEELPAGPDGVLRSEVFPGLWLDPLALLELDGRRLRPVLQRGLKTKEHAACVAELAARGERKVKASGKSRDSKRRR